MGRGGPPQINAAVLKIPKSNTKMKGIQWTKIPPAALSKTVFAKFGNLEKIPIPCTELEEEFSAKKAPEAGEEDKKEKKKGPPQIIDAKTSQNVAILLKGFKGRDVTEVVGAVRTLDETLFTEVGPVNAMIKCLPSKDDITNIEEFLKNAVAAGEPTELGTAETFALEINKLSMVDVKMAAFASKLTYPSKYADLVTDVKTLLRACREVLESKKLVRILEIILMLGNFLNSGTNRAGFAGFKFSVLSKLGDTKTADNKRTFLHYMVTYVLKHFDDLKDFFTEMGGVADACNVPGQQIEGDINSLVKSVKDVEAAVAKVRASDAADKEPFVTVMGGFAERAAVEVESLKAAYKEMNDLYVSVLAHFGEDTSKPQPPEEFFRDMNAFFESWDKAYKDNEKAREAAEKEAKREADRLKREAQKEATARKKLTESSAHKEEAVVDDLMTDVLSGAAFTSRRMKRKGAAGAGAGGAAGSSAAPH
jgi:survival motor neuron protein